MRIGKNRTSTILIEFFLFFIFLFIVSIMSTEASSEWYLSDNICLQFDRTKSCEIINDKGEILKYDADKDMISGNIQVEFKAKSETKMLNKNYRERCSKKIYKVWINEDSDNFVFIPLEDGENYFSVYYKDNSGAKIIASNSKEVQIAKSYYSVEGENCKYAITEANFTDYGEKYKYEKRYNIYGTTNNKVTLSRVLDDEAILSGVRNTYFWVDVKYPVYDEEDCYKYKDNACDKLYSFEDIVNIAVDAENEGKLIVAGTCNLCETQYTNKILTRYLEEVNDDNDMLFTWNTVKKAK